MPESFNLRKEEYLALRKEIENQLAELSNLERNCAIAASAAYTWVATTVLSTPVSQTAWFIPALIPWYGAARSYAIGKHLALIGKYIQNIEANEFPADPPDKRGWEHFFEGYGSSMTTRLRKYFWIGFIALAITCSLIGRYLTVRDMPQNKPSAQQSASFLAETGKFL